MPTKIEHILDFTTQIQAPLMLVFRGSDGTTICSYNLTADAPFIQITEVTQNEEYVLSYTPSVDYPTPIEQTVTITASVDNSQVQKTRRIRVVVDNLQSAAIRYPGETLYPQNLPRVQDLNILTVNTPRYEFYGTENFMFSGYVEDRFYRLKKVAIWTATSNGKTYVTGLSARFLTRGSISGWLDVWLYAKDPSYSYLDSDRIETYFNDYQINRFDICYATGDEFYVLGLRIWDKGSNTDYTEVFAQSDLVEGVDMECFTVYSGSGLDSTLIGFNIEMGANKHLDDFPTIRRISLITDLLDDPVDQVRYRRNFWLMRPLYYRLGSPEPAHDILYVKTLSADDSSEPSACFVETANARDLTLTPLTGDYEGYYYEVTYAPASQIGLTAGTTTIPITCSHKDRPYIDFTVPINIEIACNFETDSSCEPNILTKQDHSESTITYCSDDQTVVDVNPMTFAAAQNLPIWDSDNVKSLRFKLFAKDGQDTPEEQSYLASQATLPLQIDTSASIIGSFPTSIAYWYSNSLIDSTNILTMASFVLEDDCTVPSTPPQEPDPSLIETVPFSVGGLSATEFVDSANSFPTQDHEWYVPHKFYTITKARVWRHGNVMSGFEVTFSPNGRLQGYDEITHMFGSEGRTDYTEPFEVRRFDGWDIRWVKVFMDVDANGDRGIIGWVGDYNESPVDSCTISDCSTTNYVGIDPSYSGMTRSKKIALSNNLIGFKVKIGLSRSGLVQNIRALEFITDTTNCETAVSFTPSLDAQTLGIFSQVYMSNVPVTKTVSVRLETQWGETCPYTVINSPLVPEGDDLFTYEVLTATSFEIIFNNDQVIGAAQYRGRFVTEFCDLFNDYHQDFEIDTEVTFTAETIFGACPASEGGDGVYEPTFNVCNLAMSLGFACPQDTLYVCHNGQAQSLRDSAAQAIAQKELMISLQYIKDEQLYFGLSNTEPHSCTSFDFLHIELMVDCSDYTLPKAPIYPLPSAAPNYQVEINSQSQNDGPQYPADEKVLTEKFRKVQRIRVWAEEGKGISGFEVLYKAEPGFTGYTPVKQMFGTQTLQQDYFVIRSGSTTPKALIIYESNQDRSFSGIGMEKANGAVRSPNLSDSALLETVDLSNKILGFHTVFSKHPTEDFDRLTSIQVITDSSNCEMLSAVFSNLIPTDTTEQATLDSDWSYVVTASLSWPFDTFFDACVPAHTRAVAVNADDPSNIYEVPFIQVIPVRTTDDSGMMDGGLQDNLMNDLRRLQNVSDEKDLEMTLIGSTAQDHQAALGTHTLHLALMTTFSDADPYIRDLSEPFTIQVSCNKQDRNYPYTSQGARCPSFDWCGNNYKKDAAGKACSQFNNCILSGDGTGDVDNVTGLNCEEELTIFENAKESFDRQWPLIQFVDVGSRVDLHLDFIEQKEFLGLVELEADLGMAANFMKFSPTTGKLAIEPEESDAGQYTVKMMLLDSFEEYEKKMLLKVVGQVQAKEETPVDDKVEENKAKANEPEEEFDAKSTQDEDTSKIVKENIEEPGGESSKEKTFDEESAKQKILETKGECDEACMKEELKAHASNALQEAKKSIVKEKKIAIGGKEITLDLEGLHKGPEEGEESSQIEQIMEQVEDLPVEFQQQVFDAVLTGNAEYKRQQREIKRLEAISQGFTPPEPEPPALAFQDVMPNGDFGLYFNENVAGLAFLENLNKGLGSRGEVTESTRSLQEDAFDLSRFLTFQVQRGSEDSAAPEDLGYTILSAGLESGLLKFELLFDDPPQVSIGSIKDHLITTIIDGSFFASEENGLPIEPGTQIEQPLPKMLPGKEVIATLEATKETVQNAANTVVVAQLIITVILALSLKSMWNLMNVIQVLAYVRFFSGWPALMLEVFKYMDDAITLKPVTDPMFEYGQSQFEKANATLQDEGMKNMGVQDSALTKSLGLFLVVMMGLLFLVLIYYMVKASKNEQSISYKIKVKLEKKLFYSSFLRYMIVSNLKLNFTTWAFLIAQFSFDSFASGAKTSVQILTLVLIVLWPLFIVAFMLRNQHKLADAKFAQRWDTLYQGIHLNNKAALLYNAVFCLRRFQIVLVNMVFSPGFPLTRFDQHQYLFKQFAFIIIQSGYLIYVADTRPHTNHVFNQLEFFNEGMIILMCYIMICYAGIGPVHEIMKSKTPVYISIGITALIVLANFGVMIRMTANKIKGNPVRQTNLDAIFIAVKYKQRKQKKLQAALKSLKLDETLPETPVKVPLKVSLKTVREDSEELALESLNSEQRDEYKDMMAEYGSNLGAKAKVPPEEGIGRFNSVDLLLMEPEQENPVTKKVKERLLKRLQSMTSSGVVAQNTEQSSALDDGAQQDIAAVNEVIVEEANAAPKKAKTIKRNRDQKKNPDLVRRQSDVNSVDRMFEQAEQQRQIVLPQELKEKIAKMPSRKPKVSKTQLEQLKRVSLLFDSRADIL